MNIISDFAKDIQTSKTAPGSYEWWYFDAMSLNGISLVVIFYEGNPFSRRYIQSIETGRREPAGNFPAISIAVYKKGKPLYYGFEEVLSEKADFSSSVPKGKIKNNRFHGVKRDNKLEYSVELDQKLMNGDSISGKLIFKSPDMAVINDKSVEAGHTWNLVQPKCRVTGKLKINGYYSEEIFINCTGYHDHNTGIEPLKESFEEWYWGRFHFVDSTMVYYLMKQEGEWEKKAWLIHDNGMVSDCNQVKIYDETLNVFGIRSSKKLEFDGASFRAFLQNDVLMDNGPFYQRFAGRMVLQEGKEMKQSRGISEYLCPTRIYNKLFWPLVNMRIQYPGESHWVQRNPLLYRWTW